MAGLAKVTRLFTKVFGSHNERAIKRYHKRVEKISVYEPQIRQMTDIALRERTAEIRNIIRESGSTDELVSESFAIMREALDRNVGIRSIFNPEHQEQFDPTALSEEHQALYAQILATLETTEPQQTLGQEEPVPAWLCVDVPPELYEAVREIYPESRPPFRARPFDVQLIGAMVLHEGKISEMKTGEGKTIVAPLACFAAVVEGLRCHVVTVNDYLVQRDRDWVFPAFFQLGLTAGAIHPFHMQDEAIKREAYRCDVVYGTNSEFGFDYLRDNMKMSVDEQVQSSHDFCLIDEVDSILIDEARTPLIISGSAHDTAPQYMKANKVAEQLCVLQRQANEETVKRLQQAGFAGKMAQGQRVPEAQIEKIMAKFCDLGPDFLDETEAASIEHRQYYVAKREQRQATMTPAGVEEAQEIIGTRFYVVGNEMGWDHLINNAVRAHAVYEKDKDYVVQNREVIIVDENTGRLMVGRQWSDGLHQAIEAKESRHGVKIKQETQTLATVTIQNFFKLYKRLAGMTGTAVTESVEFYETYRMDVVCIPTNLPVVRDDREDLIFIAESAKWQAILEDIQSHAEQGQPVLVGTTSVEKSEYLSNMLRKKYKLDHEVLNAKQHEREAQIVKMAGQQHADKRGRTMGNVTIATNMAGRGTDIKLDQLVKEAGGLHIIGTERHEARRIDNQLRGRAGRQGDPGSSRFFISMEDDLMKMFAGPTTMKALAMLGMKDEDAIEHRWITKSVERAQRKVEERNFQVRKNLLEYDEVMEYQRSFFYKTRQTALEGKEIQSLVFDYIGESIEDAVAHYLSPDYVAHQVSDAVQSMIQVQIDPARFRKRAYVEVVPIILSHAKADVRQEIDITVGEYMGDEIDANSWDLKGLSQWAMSRFSADLKMAALKTMTPREVVDRLTDAAHALLDRRSFDGLEPFFEDDYGLIQIAKWAQDKYDLPIAVEELQGPKNETSQVLQQRVAEFLYDKAIAAYRQREIEYPVQYLLEMAMGASQHGEEGGAWAIDQVVQWANGRYALGWTVEHVVSQTGREVHDALVEEGKAWTDDRIAALIDEQMAEQTGEALYAWLTARFVGVPLSLADYQQAERDGTVREVLCRSVRQLLRTELTQLEQYVLLQILDQSWKDHLFSMDQLKDAIGLRGFAERDPKIEYKTEGAGQFKRMLRGVRDKVTDLIFKARLTANVQVHNAYADQEAHHDVTEGTGVSAAGYLDQAANAQQADLATAQRAGQDHDEGVAVAPIVREGRKVGRNDPCPCGSGQKYKKCCGLND